MLDPETAEFSIDVEFDWDTELTQEMQMLIAEYGSTEMRLRLLNRDDVSRRALNELLDTRNSEVVVAARLRIFALDQHREWVPGLEPQTPLAKAKRWFATTLRLRPAAPCTSVR